MKIAIVAPEVFPVPPVRGGAVETIIEEVSRCFRGHPIYILGVSDPSLPLQETVLNRTYLRWKRGFAARILLSSWRLPFKKSSSKHYYHPYRRWLEKQIKILQPDVIWLHTRVHFAAGLKKAAPRAKLILSLHNESNLKDAAVWDAEAAGACDLITACSKSLAVKAAAKYPHLKEKLRVLYNGADLEHFTMRKEEDSRTLKERLGFSAAQPVICFAGRLVPEKGAHVLLEAFRKVREEVPETGLCVIGAHTFSDGKETDYIRDLKKTAAEMESRVRFTGHVSREEMPRYFQACDVFAFPSQWEEPFGMSLVEAMACGLPAAAFEGGGPSEILEPMKTGILIPKEKGAAGLSDALIMLLKNPGQAQAFGRAARQSAEERFSWRRIAGVFCDYAEGLLQGGTQSAPASGLSNAGFPAPLEFQPEPPSQKKSSGVSTPSAGVQSPVVLIAESGSGFGGTAKYLRSLAAHIDPSKFRLLIAAYHRGPFIEKIAEDGFIVIDQPGWRYPGPVELDGKWGRHKLLWASAAHLLKVPSICGWLRKNGVEIVHLNNEILSHIPLLIAARLAGCRILCHLHGWRPFTKIEKLFLPLVDRLICISQAGAGYYGGQLKGRRVSAVVNGISLNGELNGLAEKRKSLRNNLGIFDNEKVFLIPGRLVPWKGQDTFLKALGVLAKKYPFVIGMIAGHDGSEGQVYTRELQDLVRRTGIERNVHFLPWQSDMWSLYAAADIVVHASKRPEPFGLVLLEAMAAGKPVIASAAGGVPDIVIDGETGYLTAPGDENALAAAMEKMLSRPDISSGMMKAASERLYSHFSMTRNAGQIQEIYRNLMDLKKGAPAQ